MSDKKRQKKDGQNKDKKNQAKRESENPRELKANSPVKSRDQSNLTDSEAGAATSNRKASKSARSPSVNRK